jgi:hypothetical protein
VSRGIDAVAVRGLPCERVRTGVSVVFMVLTQQLRTWLAMTGLALGMTGCPEGGNDGWYGCETSVDCASDERCVLDRVNRVGECVPEEDDPPTAECTMSPVIAGTRTQPVSDAGGNVIVVFDFTQTRLTGPAPCDPDLTMSAKVSNASAVPRSFSYTINFYATTNGALQGSYSNTVLDLAPGTQRDLGPVFQPDVNLQYLQIMVNAVPL